MENNVTNKSFPLKLENFDEVTLPKVGISHLFILTKHVDTLKNWMEGLCRDLVEKFIAHLSEPQF